jgi:hypothetical protein
VQEEVKNEGRDNCRHISLQFRQSGLIFNQYPAEIPAKVLGNIAMSNGKTHFQTKFPATPVPMISGSTLQRKCACGTHTVAGDKCDECKNKQTTLQRKSSNNFEHSEAPPIVHEVLNSSGEPLDKTTRAFFEPRFAHNFSKVPVSSAAQKMSSSSLTIGEPADVYEQEADRTADSIMLEGKTGTLSTNEQEGGKFDLSQVRIHTGARAAESAQAINAQAYTLGHNIVFGAGQFAPGTQKGRHLLAHELTHVAQQGAASHVHGKARHSLNGHHGQTIRRAPLEILPADSKGTPKADERKAAASCGIDCDGTSVGTLHAMPIFFHASRGAASTSSAGADGISVALHFIRVTTVLPKNNGCLNCTDFKTIQIINSNEPADSRGKESFVDNAASATPFYGDVYASGVGLHTIHSGLGFSDEGSQIKTTHSIYDSPYRPAANLGKVTGKNFFWNAEACVACVKPGKDKVLGCATYGFKRDWDAAKKSHGPVQTVGPGCLAKPSSHFVTTLTTDSSTSSYDFET